MKAIITLFVVSLLSGILGGFCMAQDSTEVRGKLLFKEFKCINCHAIEKQGILKKGKSSVPDLSEVGSKLAAEFLSKYLKKEESQNDLKHPINFKGSDEELSELVNWLSQLKKIEIKDSASVK